MSWYWALRQYIYDDLVLFGGTRDIFGQVFTQMWEAHWELLLGGVVWVLRVGVAAWRRWWRGA